MEETKRSSHPLYDSEEIPVFFSIIIEKFYEIKRIEEARAKEEEIIEVSEEVIPETDIKAAGNLLNDMIMLFNIGDLDGGLISFERLVLLYENDPKLNKFIQKYRERLCEIYDDIFINQNIKLSIDDKELEMFSHLGKNEKIVEVLNYIKQNQGEIDKLAEENDIYRLKKLALINFLTRPGIVKILRN